MNKLRDHFGDDVFKIIVSKLYENKCIFENCYKEAGMLGKYCKRHWCKDGHSTTQIKYMGYCENCFTRIMKTNNKNILKS